MSALLDQCHDQMSAAQLIAHHQAREVEVRDFGETVCGLAEHEYFPPSQPGLILRLWRAFVRWC